MCHFPSSLHSLPYPILPNLIFWAESNVPSNPAGRIPGQGNGTHSQQNLSVKGERTEGGREQREGENRGMEGGREERLLYNHAQATSSDD